MVQICVTRPAPNSSDTFLRHSIPRVGLLSADALLERMPRESRTEPMCSPATADAWLLIDYHVMCDCLGPLSLADFIAGYRHIDQRFASHPVALPEMQLAS
jgi:hypothetical protein